jgi:hypothetical protein
MLPLSLSPVDNMKESQAWARRQDKVEWQVLNNVVGAPIKTGESISVRR